MWPTGSAVLFDLSEWTASIYELNKQPVARYGLKTTLSLFSLDLFAAHIYLEKRKFKKVKIILALKPMTY